MYGYVRANEGNKKKDIPQCEQVNTFPCFTVAGYIKRCSSARFFASFKSLRHLRFDEFKNVRVPSQELRVHSMTGCSHGVVGRIVVLLILLPSQHIQQYEGYIQVKEKKGRGGVESQYEVKSLILPLDLFKLGFFYCRKNLHFLTSCSSFFDRR